MAQIGTTKVQTPNGSISLPVFDIADAGTGVYDVVRIQTPSGVGFIPFTETSDAAHTNVRIKTPNHGIIAAHDQASLYTRPDSTIHQWKFNEGSGSTASDSIGSADGTIYSENWVSGNWFENHAIDGNGSTNINIGDLGSFGSTIDGTFTFAATIQTTSGDGGVLMFDNSGDSTRWYPLYMGSVSQDSISSGSLGCSIRDSGSDTIRVSTDNRYDDGNKYRVVVVKSSGSYASSLSIYVNGSEVSTSSGEDEGISGPNNFDQSIRLFARRAGGGGVSDYWNGVVDNVMLFNDALTTAQIEEDYQNQPWS